LFYPVFVVYNVLDVRSVKISLLWVLWWVSNTNDLLKESTMSQKYKRILSAAKYYSAIDNYIKYITDATKRGQRVGNGTARDASMKAYVEPFGIDLPGTNTFAETKVTVPTWELYKALTAVSNRTKVVKIDTDFAVELKQYRPAAVMIVIGRSPKGTPDTSKVTGMKYLKYGGRSRTLPFGRGPTEAETEQEAFLSISSAIRNASANTTMSLRKEKF
jgi:hypothetical protein